MILGNALGRDDGRRGHRARARLDPDRGRARRRGRRGRRARRAREDLGGAVVTPGLVNTHHHLYQTLTRARAQQADLFTWLKTLYPTLGAHRRRDGVRRRARRARRARALGLHDRLRPPLRVPARRLRASSRQRCAPRRSSACASSPRAARWTSASRTAGCRPTRSSRTIDAILADTERLAALARRRPRRADRRRALLAVLGHDAADGGVGGARAPARAAAAHAPRRDGRGGRVLPRALRLHAGRVPRARRLARRRRLVRALRPPLGRRRARRSRAHGVGVAHCPTSNLRLGAGVAPVRRPARRRRARRARRRRHRVERAQRPLRRGEERAARRARARRPGGDDRARGAAARDARRRRGAARDDIGSLEPGKRADLAVWRTDGLEFGGADDLVGEPRPERPAPRRPAARRRRATSCAAARSCTRDEQEIAREHRKAGAEALGMMTVSTHVLDTERGRPAAGVHVELYGPDGSLAGAGVTDDDGRIARARRVDAGHLPDRLPPAVAVLQARRARDRARRGPLPRPAPDLLVRVRELPRQLTADELAELFEGRTRFVERLAALEDPLGHAREVALELSDDEQKELLDAHPAIGGKATSARSAAEQGSDDDPSRARRARAAERRVRGEVRLPLRRLRQPPAAARDRADPPRAAAAHARARSWRRPSTSSSRSRSTGGSRPSALATIWWDWGNILFRWLHVIAAMAWIGASFYFIALDNHLEPPNDPDDARARRRRRGVGDPRRRLLPRREVPRRARAAARAAALVQVGGVHDVALRLRAVHRRLLRARDVVPDRSRPSPTSTAWQAIAISIAGLALAWLVYDALCRTFANDEGAARRARVRVRLRCPRGRRASSSRRARRTCRSAR